MEQIIYSTPVLRAETSKGLPKFWRGHVLETSTGLYYTQSESWQQLKDGSESVRTFSEPALVEAKNVGKRNETVPRNQAIAEIEATAKKQRDKKGYRAKGEAAGDIVLPMLAKKYAEDADKLDWDGDVYVQPKLDGHRALLVNGRFTTRGGQIHAPHIQELAFETNGLSLDGELMLDPNAPCCVGLDKTQRFQLTAKAVKKFYPELAPYLLYCVYDAAVDDLFIDRYNQVCEVFINSEPKQAMLVPTFPVRTPADVQQKFEEFLELGFEGAMVRDNSAGYVVKHRHKQLQKMKPVDSGEFEVIDVVVAGKGKAARVGKFLLNTPGGITEAVAIGSEALRRDYLENKQNYVGKLVTVEFDGVSPEGKLRFPRVIGVREEWDS